MPTTVLRLSRTARAAAFAASLLATTAMLSINLGLVRSYTNSDTATADMRADCASQGSGLSEEIVPHEISKERPS